uniref:Cilia- and flagella-associated protein 263 n=1 Tax=Kryptolebias marmoratus TaxID=37003 RepID=A0A3Q3BI62_KRYMA
IGCLDPQDLDVERRQNLCSNLSDPLQLLTLEQKLYVLQREVTDTQQDQEKLQQKHERIQDNYKASVKEAELRLAEIRKAKKEFEHRLSKSMKDRQHFTLQFVLPLQEKLQTATLDSAELSNEITKRNLMLAKIDEEIQQAEKERLKAESLNQLLHKELTDYQAPDIMAYMSAKDKQKKLQQSIHSWERKVEIAEHLGMETGSTFVKEWVTLRSSVNSSVVP